MQAYCKRWIIPFIFLTGFLVRMVFVPNPGFEADMSFWKSWGLAPYDHGIVWSMFNTNNNYPTPFAYLLWFITGIYSLFSNPHIFNEFWANTNLLFLTLMKLPAILADLGIAALLLWFTKYLSSRTCFGIPSVSRWMLKRVQHDNWSWEIILPALYLFNPIAIFDSAVWGQVDSLGVFLFLIAVIFVLKKKPFLAGLLYMVALMTKLQNMIYGPLFFLFVFQMTGYSGLVSAIAGSVLGFFGLNVEFLISKNMARVIESLTANYDYFPYMSLNAYNIWWIVAKGAGMQMSDKLLTIGIIDAKTMGLLLFSGFYLFASLSMLLKKNTETIHSFFTALIIAAGSFFLFQTESHDRYAFPLIVFLLFWILLSVHAHLTVKERVSFWKTKWFRYSMIGYVLFSGIYFLNMHTAFIANYPQNGIPWLLFLNSPSWTISLSVLLTLGFFLFLNVNRKSIGFSAVLVCVMSYVICVLFLNSSLITHTPISLTKLTPPIHSQEFGLLTTNMPVNAKVNNPKTWDRLSVQYFFYRKGLGTHANSLIIYDLTKRFSKFSTDYGIDTEAGPQATVVFEIYGDDKLLFRSEVMKRFDYPKHTEVDIIGVSQLKLVVTDSGNGNIDDHADWLNPILYP